MQRFTFLLRSRIATPSLAVRISRSRRFSILSDISEVRRLRKSHLLSGETVGLVPTLGALHEGHLSLIRQAARENKKVFVTIYLNPLQFAATEDFRAYPKTWDEDIAKLRHLQADLLAPSHSGETPYGSIAAVFAPSTETLYPTLPPSSDPDADGTFVTVSPLDRFLEGGSRPTFFRGVATVCTKLFNIVTPDRVYFGQKDVQQSVIIKRLVKDLCIGTEVIIGPTQRDSDGLALSSRNVYLGARRRKVALSLRRGLKAAEELYSRGETSAERLVGCAMSVMREENGRQRRLDPTQAARFVVDYVRLSNVNTLEDEYDANIREGSILSAAIKVLPLDHGCTADGESLGVGNDAGEVRLIDNVILPPRSQSTRSGRADLG